MLNVNYSHPNSNSDPRPLPNNKQRDTALYMADFVLELRNMAKLQKLYKLTTALEFAYYEAFSVANKAAIPAAEIAYIKKLQNAANVEQFLSVEGNLDQPFGQIT